MRIFVELPGELDVAQWRVSHERGVAPDPVPYGLHHLAERDGDLVRFRRPPGPRVAALGRAVAGRTWGWDFVAEARALTERARRSADVVLCMDERTGGPAALAPARVPVVTGVGWLEHRRSLGAVLSSAATRALRFSAAVFTQCPAMVDGLVDEFGVDAGRVHHVRMGVDVEHFTPQAWPDEDALGVFSVGDDRMRDHATLVAAMALVRAREPRAWLRLATTLPVDMPARSGEIVARRLDHEVRGYYAGASVVAVALEPTRQGSGLTVALEAMACGRPLVVTANPGLERYVEHGVTGLLVPPKDPAAMADAISGLLADPVGAREMGAEGRRAVERSFTSAHMSADIRRVLDRVA